MAEDTNAPAQDAQEAALAERIFLVVVDETEEPERLHGIPFDRPTFHWYTRALRDRQLIDDFRTRYAIGSKELRRAIAAADAAVAEMKRLMREAQCG